MRDFTAPEERHVYSDRCKKRAKLRRSDMFWLAAVFLRHAAPPEFKQIMARLRFYKHVAPLELKRGCASVLLSRRAYHCAGSSRAATILPNVRASSSPARRRSGERIEERGSHTERSLLSPALSSIGWRRGSVWLRFRRAGRYAGQRLSLDAPSLASRCAVAAVRPSAYFARLRISKRITFVESLVLP